MPAIHYFQLMARVALVAVILAAWPSLTRAQSPESDPAPGVTPPPEPAGGYRMPDVPDKTLNGLRWVTRFFSAQVGLALLLDYTLFSQDSNNKAQVGDEKDEFEVRAARFMLRGRFKVMGGVGYKATLEYNGFEHEPDDPNWAFTSLYLTFDLGYRAGKLTVGKQKEPHVYELLSDAANLPQSERLLNPFFKSHNVGLTLANTWLGQRATWSVGWYNDWWTNANSFKNSGNDFAARFTFLPVWRNNSSRYLHLGASGRFYGGDNDQIKYQGKPETNVGPVYVNSGNLAADHAWHLGLEALWADRSYSILAEYTRAWTRAAAVGYPSFYGYYVTASYLINGQVRPYDRQTGYARRPPVKDKWGHIELVGRFGHVDITDAAVNGGVLNRWTLGASWWANKRWRFTVTYGNATLDREALQGQTRIALFRMQWIY